MNRGLFLAVLPLAAGAAAYAQQAKPAQGQQQGGGLSVLRGHDSNAPVDVTSDRIEVQDRADRAIFVGNVHVVQGDMTMDAPRMTVAYARAQAPNSDPQLKRIDASGGVTVVSPGEKAKGQYGIYDIDRRLITMIGDVTLTKGGNTVNGARLVIDMNTGRSTVDGSAVGGAAGTTTTGKGGRVTGRFTVPQRTQDANKPAGGASGALAPAPAQPPR